MHTRSSRARLTVTASSDALAPVARVLEDGGLAAIAWGHPRRAIYALVARADDRDATRRLNCLKGRPPAQVLAVAGATQVATHVADLSPSGALSRVAAARGLSVQALLERMYATGPVALMLEARDAIPPAITKVDELGRARVLVVGQSPQIEPDNFYDQLVNHLATQRGVLLAGTSGNRSGLRTHTSRDHESAEADFGADLDVFVRPQLPLPSRRPWDAPVSCSGFDLTAPEAVLIRHGSLHPDVFGSALRRYDVSASVQRITGRQSAVAGLLERATRWRRTEAATSPT
jgi:tRNA A37 threonylcarbamoyladenosine synthetase subunit TsaC/SUA5/YrdC